QMKTTGAFDASTVLANPFVSIPFINSVFDVWAVPGDPTPPSPNVVNVLSLRHSFTFNATKDLLLVRRHFESSRRKTHEGKTFCTNGYQFGWRFFQIYKQRFGPLNPLEAAKRVDCVGLVLNSAGNGVCVQNGARGLFASIYTNTGWE